MRADGGKDGLFSIANEGTADEVPSKQIFKACAKFEFCWKIVENVLLNRFHERKNVESLF